MICLNMNKRSTKIICFAISMDYYVCPVQVLVERFTRKFMKHGFNHCYAVVNDGKFWSTLVFSKFFCSTFFSIINGCLIENALCSDVICSAIAIGGGPPDGSLAVSAYNKILFFSPLSFFNHDKGQNHLCQKQSIILWNEIIKLY